MQALDIRDFEIERRLDAFARARLTPDPRSVARARARVMREARLQRHPPATGAGDVAALAFSSHRSTARRLAMPLLAASLWLGVAVGSVAAAQAGGPLYATRIWIETATLPADPVDRTAAEISRLDARLADALTAAARGDTGAVAAALTAYGQIADDLITASAGIETLEDLVSAALDRHRALLTAVAASLLDGADSAATTALETAILRALEHNAAVVASFAANDGVQPAGGGAPVGAGAAAGAGGGGISGGATGGSAGQAPAGAASGGNDASTGAGAGAGSGAGADPGAGSPPDPGAKPSARPKPSPGPAPSTGRGGPEGR